MNGILRTTEESVMTGDFNLALISDNKLHQSKRSPRDSNKTTFVNVYYMSIVV